MRVGGGEKTRHRAAFGNTENVGAFDADIIHHCANVISALLQRRHFHRSIGKARAAFVEANKAAELAEALEKRARRGISQSRSRCDIVPGAHTTSNGPSPV